VLAAVAGCGGSKHPKAAATTAAGSGSGAAATSAIKTAFITFFDGTKAIDTRLGYLQNAPTFEQALSAQADSPLIKQTVGTVTSVALTGANTAKVIYSVALGKTPVLPNQTGTAVLIGGQWKVAAATFCALLTLEGAAPAACAQATVTALPS
jgi:hypothetical protein